MVTEHRTQVFDGLLDSFVRGLRAENAAPKTIVAYSEAVRHLDRFLRGRGMPIVASNVSREYIEEFLADQLARWKPATANNRYRALKRFFGWLVEEGEITESPMERIRPPRVPETPPAVLTQDDLRRLLRVCEGKSFEDRRDAAIVSLLIDSGCRRGELADLRMDDVDLDRCEIRVVGKGRRARTVPVGRNAALTVDRYLRLRAHHLLVYRPEFWLGPRGPVTNSGIAQIVEKRAKRAGLAGVHAHLFRHTFAHEWLAAEGNEGDLMLLAGWRSRSMLERYGKSAAAERARAADRSRSPLDRL
jgi:site-specific recombinase XerD